ncbi:hypothetical protein IU450_29385 [Nocardia abscessus]|uniref:hypothetical protein n=1 Tax=Nocardia abscessus TaxID=120957 RepID=UPI0018953597|nr:hypothetical protein [Nocardia abscessus]MBF6339969.1 hypothetical protein [Nocardia abscessus]
MTARRRRPRVSPLPTAAIAYGPLAARIALDGIRAAENSGPLALPGPDTEVAMWGYSGVTDVGLHRARTLTSAAVPGSRAHGWSAPAPVVGVHGKPIATLR